MKLLYTLLALLTTASLHAADKKFDVGSWPSDSFDDTDTYPVTVAGEEFYAPFCFPMTYSGSQTIYTAEELKPLSDDEGTISAITIMFYDDSFFDEAICSFKLYLTPIQDDSFTPDDDGKLHWLPYSEEDLFATLDYDEYLYYDTFNVNYITFTLSSRYNYTGGNILMTLVAENSTKTTLLKTYHNDVGSARCLAMASDTESWEECHASGIAPGEASTCRPPLRITYKPFTAQSAIRHIEATPTDDTAVYHNLQGMRIDDPVKGQLYIVTKGATSSKVRL